MTFRLLKNFTWVVMFAGALTACAQVDDPPASPAAAIAGRGVNNNPGHNQFAPHSRAGQADPPADPPNDPPNDPPAQSPITGGNFWDHLRADFQLPPSANNAEVQAQINWYMHHQTYLNRIMNRAAPYMYYILDQVQQRNLPGELVLLPIMESAYNPFANSYRGAVGLWQLMTPTASGFGVKHDWWYDGRRDIYASTNAALDYLTYLQSYFGGDWLLAIAAYDAGEGGVQMAVRRNARENKPTDFWSLSLPAETQSYVPRLLALASIISNPSRYSITLPPIDDQPYLQQVDLGAPINLAQAAQLAGMSLADLKQLNPAYSHMTTDPNGPYKLLLPIDKIATFKENLATAPSLTRTLWGRYKVQHGDTLTSIAKRYHTTVTELRDANQLRGHKAPVGKVIMIPTGTVTVTPHLVGDEEPNYQSNTMQVVPASTPATRPSQNNNPNPQTPNSGFTNQLNNGIDTTTEPLNQITPLSQSPENYTPRQQVHIIKTGETLFSLAKRYHVSVDNLRSWNRLKANKPLKPGTQLVIHLATHKQAGEPPQKLLLVNNEKVKKSAKTTSVVNKRHYTIRSGDTLSRIANHLNVKLSDLKKWNHLASNSALKPGQRLVIES